MKLLDYIKGDRKGKEAHRIELEAMSDPFLADALEGLDTIDGDHERTMERLRERISVRSTPNRRRRAIVWSTAAAVLVCLTLGGLLIMNRPDEDRATVAALKANVESDSASQTLATTGEQEAPEISQDEIALPEAARPEEITGSAIMNDTKITADFNSSAEPMENAIIIPKATATEEVVANEAPRMIANQAKESVPAPQQQSSLLAAQAARSDETAVPAVSMDETAKITAPEVTETAPAPSAANTAMAAAMQRFNEYVARNLVPQQDEQGNPISGTVTIQFGVDAKGRPIGLRVTQMLATNAYMEAVRLILGGPDWPVTSDKITVNISF